MIAPIDVSVIVCTYNRKNWLKDCLDALLNQTYKKSRYEIIVVDDGSSDGTKEVVHGYKGVIYLQQPNNGMAAARNLGLSVARGRIIAFTDDDCLPSKDWIQQGILVLSETGLDGVEGITTTDKGKTSPLSLLTYTYHGGGFMTSNCFYKKSVLDTVGGFSSAKKMKFREDTDLAWKIMDRGCKLGFDERPEVFHRVVKLTAWKNVQKHIRLRQPWWNAFLNKYHSNRYHASSEILFGVVSTQMVYTYLFWAVFLLAVMSYIFLPLSAFILSLVIFAENYLIVVFLHTRMRSGIEVRHLLMYPGEFMRLALVWWIAILSDTFWKIAGTIVYNPFFKTRQTIANK